MRARLALVPLLLTALAGAAPARAGWTAPERVTRSASGVAVAAGPGGRIAVGVVDKVPGAWEARVHAGTMRAGTSAASATAGRDTRRAIDRLGLAPLTTPGAF